MWYLSSWRDLRRRSNASHGLLNKPEITPPSHSNHRRAGTNTPYKAWLNSVSAPQSRMCALAHPNHNNTGSLYGRVDWRVGRAGKDPISDPSDVRLNARVRSRTAAQPPSRNGLS